MISLAGQLFQESLSIFVIRLMFQCSANAAEGGGVVLLSVVNQGQVEVNRGRRHAVGQRQIQIVDGLLIVLQFEMEKPSIHGGSSNGRVQPKGTIVIVQGLSVSASAGISQPPIEQDLGLD